MLIYLFILIVFAGVISLTQLNFAPKEDHNIQREVGHVKIKQTSTPPSVIVPAISAEVVKAPVVVDTVESIPYTPVEKPPVYFILDDSNNIRKKHVEEMTRVLENFDVHIWNAVPSNTIEYGKYSKFTNPKTFSKVRRGAIGCALAHITLLEHISKNEKSAVVLESDAEVSSTFEEDFFEFVENLPSNFEFGQLLHHKNMKKKRANAKIINPFVMNSYAPYGTVGYYVTRAGAKKVLPTLKPIWHPIDEMFRTAIEKRTFVSYMPVKDLVTMPYKHESTIWNTKVEAKRPEVPDTKIPCELFPNRWKNHGSEMITILQAFHNIMEDIGVDYGLVGGALLAYVRQHGQPMPWDDDLDVFVHPKDVLRVKAAIDKTKLYCHASLWLGFKMFRCDSPRIGNYKWRYPMIDIFTTKSYASRAKSMFPSQLVTFAGIKTRVPKDTSVFVKRYGADHLDTCKPHHWNHKTEKPLAKGKTWPCKDIMEQCHNDLFPPVQQPVKLDHCVNKLSGDIWQAFKSMVSILEYMKADYSIAGGTVLFWYRDCTLGTSDVDIRIDLSWFGKNQQELHRKLRKRGWKMQARFGTFPHRGYEEAWVLNGVKCDLFGTKRVEGFHLMGFTVKGVTYPCKSFLTHTEQHTWGGVTFKVPAPIETYLHKRYGNWKEKHIEGYRWDVEPFKSDNGRELCSKTETFDDMETPPNCLKLSLGAYKRNLNPRYDTDTPVREGKLYQFNVYNRAMTLAQEFEKKWIIDIGCGSGRKLAAMHSVGFSVVGIDFGANLQSTRKKLPPSDTVILKECNLNEDMPDLPETIIQNAVFVSADVIEHLTNPDNLIKIVKKYIKLGAVGVVSTPDNEKLSRTLTPQRPSDVQVWSKSGFEKYFACHRINFHSFERLNNNVDMIANGVGVQIGSSIEPKNFFSSMQESGSVEILIPTMSRHDKVFELVTSIRKFYSFPIIVVDDGRESGKNLYGTNCVSCSYYWVGYDKGLSYKRNFAVKKSLSKYVVLLDDDMIMTKSVDITEAIKVLEKQTDVVGFNLDDRKLVPVETRVVNGQISRCQLEHSTDRCKKTDYVLNNFIAKRKVLLENKWDEDLKLAEHSVFFLMLKQKGIHVKLCEHMLVKHNNKKRSVYQDSKYDSLRGRASKEFRSIVEKKYGFHKVNYNTPKC